jgi:hypothetical protein
MDAALTSLVTPANLVTPVKGTPQSSTLRGTLKAGVSSRPAETSCPEIPAFAGMTETETL